MEKGKVRSMSSETQKKEQVGKSNCFMMKTTATGRANIFVRDLQTCTAESMIVLKWTDCR